jgi:hypothetical protein
MKVAEKDVAVVLVAWKRNEISLRVAMQRLVALGLHVQRAHELLART